MIRSEENHGIYYFKRVILIKGNEKCIGIHE